MKRRFPLHFLILSAMALGAAAGLALGARAEPLGELGKVLIQLIKALAGPLLFFAVVDAFLRTRVRARSAAVMFGIGAINATIALVIGLSISNLLKPGVNLEMGAARTHLQLAPLASGARRIDFLQAITGLVPTSITQPFNDNAVLSIIMLAVLVGLALRKIKDEQDGRLSLEEHVATGLRAVEVMLGWVVKLIPLAVFGVVAKTVGQHGFAPLRGLAIYVAVALLGLALQIGVVYQAWLYFSGGSAELRRFWTGAKDAIFYALGASSSLATLPVTLKCLDRMGVSTQSARLAACVGSNFNHDGIILYEAMAVLFVAQVHGIQLGVGQQALAAVSCLVAGIGIAGVPEAGLISLALVLGTVGLPTEILPLLLTVDWVLSRGRAITNVLSDIVLSMLLDKLVPPASDVRASRSPATS
ncbi:MAG: dicarboxylate/amino acid:cation symporter [Deltaproteobacteria bacterium]|nr:dicarboxylate/amino acid:cation symporter [Deltaproteobacteria bacterium]